MDFPTKQKLHIKSWISRLSKKAQTDRLHKEFSRSFFFFFSFSSFFIKLIPDRFPVAFMFSLKLPQKDYLQASGALAGTSDYKSHPNSCRSRCVESSWRYRRYRCLLRVWKVGRTFCFECLLEGKNIYY